MDLTQRLIYWRPDYNIMRRVGDWFNEVKVSKKYNKIPEEKTGPYPLISAKSTNHGIA